MYSRYLAAAIKLTAHETNKIFNKRYISIDTEIEYYLIALEFLLEANQ